MGCLDTDVDGIVDVIEEVGSVVFGCAVVRWKSRVRARSAVSRVTVNINRPPPPPAPAPSPPVPVGVAEDPPPPMGMRGHSVAARSASYGDENCGVGREG